MMDKIEACALLNECKENRLTVAELWARRYARCNDSGMIKVYEEGAHVSLCLVLLGEAYTAPILKDHKDILRRMFHLLDIAELQHGIDAKLTKPAKDCVFSLMEATSNWDVAQIISAQESTQGLINKLTDRLAGLARTTHET